MQFHDVANIFPLLEGDELTALANDIQANGLITAIWTYQGKIIDGRNRFRACEMVGVAPRYQEWGGGTHAELVAFVVSLNIKRRHLTSSQLIPIGVILEREFALEAKERMARGVQNLRQYADIPAVVNLPQPGDDDTGKARDKAAAVIGIAGKYISEGKRIAALAPELLTELTAGTMSAQTAAQIATLPKAERAEIIARGEKEIIAAAKEIRGRITTARRQERIAKIVTLAENNQPLTIAKRGPYAVIYADPPWQYAYSETESRAIENQYPTMPLADICALPVTTICMADCVLYLWATSPKLADALTVIKAWGFEYRTCAVWVKDKIGMGYYFRQQHELLLIATRGSLPTPEPQLRVSSIISEARGQHSTKPESVAQLLELWYPQFPKVELFCRKARAGWDVWGNQAYDNA